MAKAAFADNMPACSFAQIHVSLVPVINGEQKTKPTQASIRDLRAHGLTADFVSRLHVQIRDGKS